MTQLVKPKALEGNKEQYAFDNQLPLHMIVMMIIVEQPWYMVPAMVYAGQKRVLGIHKTQNSVEMLMHRARVTHHHCPLAL